MNRREMLLVCRRRCRRRAFCSPGPTRRSAAAAQATQAGSAAGQQGRTRRASSPRTSTRRLARSSDMILPKDDRSVQRVGGRHRRVHRLHRRRTARAPDRDAWRPRVARHRVPARFDKSFVPCTATERAPGARRYRVAAQSPARDDATACASSRRSAIWSPPASSRARSASPTSAIKATGRRCGTGPRPKSLPSWG